MVSADSETIRPCHTACKQIVLADHAITMLHEEGEQIEGLGLEIDKLAAAAQFAAFDVEPVFAKRQNTAILPRPFCENHKPP